MVKRKEHLGTVETEDQGLCRKWCTDNFISARSLENEHQYILNIIRQPNVLDNMKKSSAIYFAQKIEFEDLFKRGIVKTLWDYYQTKDERLKFWRDLIGKEYNVYMEKIRNGEKPYN